MGCSNITSIAVVQTPQDEILEAEVVAEDDAEVEVEFEYIETIVDAPVMSIEEVAQAVLKGQFGNGAERILSIEALGFDAKEVQSIVNRLSAEDDQLLQDQPQLHPLQQDQPLHLLQPRHLLLDLGPTESICWEHQCQSWSLT